jgi:small subunit ribosomal protein S17
MEMAEQEDTTTESGETPTTEAPAQAEPEATPSADSSQGASVEDASPSATGADAASVEPQEVLAPKERRVRARAAKAAKAPAQGPRTAQERQADRDARRADAAKSRQTRRAKETTKHKAEAHNRTSTPAREQVAGQQKVRQGIVVSDKADKTITVRIDVARRHRRYEKIVRTSQTFHVHDESNDAHMGDTVTIRECRPLSRSKRWRLVDVLERAR